MNNEDKIIELLTDIKGLLVGFSKNGQIEVDLRPIKKVSRPQQNSNINLFAEFWSIYPKKVGRKECMKKWASRKMDNIADTLMSDVKNRIQNDAQWIDGFIPNPATYLNGDRWNDDIQAAIQPVTKANPSDYIIPQDWKERGLCVGVKPLDNEKYADFRIRVLRSEFNPPSSFSNSTYP